MNGVVSFAGERFVVPRALQSDGNGRDAEDETSPWFGATGDEGVEGGSSWPQAEFDVSDGLDGHVVVHASGEIDVSAKSLFEERLADATEATDGDVVVDMADVSFCDSTGIAVLLRARKQLEPAGRKLLIVRPSPSVIHVLEIAGVDALFDHRG